MTIAAPEAGTETAPRPSPKPVTQSPTPSSSPPKDSNPPVDPSPDSYSLRRPPGRPRKGEEVAKPPALPRPVSFKGIRVAQFIDYWLKTDRKFPRRLVVYVYRSWPVTQRERCGLNKYIDVLAVGANPPAEGNISAEDLHDADNFETYMLHHFGSGDYKLILNDTALSREVCQVYPKFRDPDKLPIVEPLASLVLEDPINRPYIEALTRKGVQIPGMNSPEGEEEDDVAKVTTELTGTVERLVDTVVRQSEERNREDTRQPKRPDPDTASLSTGLDIVSKAAAMGTQIVDSAVRKAGEIQATVASQPAASPVEVLKGFVDLHKSLVPAGPQSQDPTSGLTGILITRLLEQGLEDRRAAQAAIESNNQLIRDLLLNRQAASPLLPGGVPGIAPVGGNPSAAPGMGVAPASLQPQSPLSSLKELVAMKSDLQDLLGVGVGGGEDDPSNRSGNPASFWERMLPGLLQVGMVMANSIATGIYNLAVAKSGQGQPVAPPALQAAGTDNPQPGDQLPAPPGSGQPQLPTTQDPTLQAYHQFLASVKDPLLKAINEGRTGDEFAETLVEFQGEMTYEFLRELGKDKLLAILSTYPPIWEYAAKIPARFDRFVDEFLSFGEDDGGEEPEPTVHRASPPPAPVRDARPTGGARHKPPKVTVTPRGNGGGGGQPAATDVMAGDPLAGAGMGPVVGPVG